MQHIDPTSLEAFFEDDTELLIDLALLFGKALGDCKARSKYALENRDASTLCETMHLLNGRLGYFSAAGLQNLACAIETMGKQNQINDACPLVTELFVGIEEMMNELRQITGMPLVYEDDDE